MVELIKTENKSKPEVSISNQIKKFAINGLYGFNTIILIGMGRRLGIFNYLYEKAKSSPSSGKNNKVIFTPNELSENLNLDFKYLDGWLHLALECGIFEIANSGKKILKTAPYVYDLLIDRNNEFYIGGTLGAFYYMAPAQDILIENFKTGKIWSLYDLPGDVMKDIQERGARFGTLVERLFSKKYENFCKNIQKQGTILEVGCGYGFNLETWAKKYKKARFVGIDIDPIGLTNAKKIVDINNWNERIEIFESTIEKFTHSFKEKFDLIILNQVLHEMNTDENYRKGVFKNLYSLLKDDGILLIGESMIPDTFAPKKKFQLFDITHKFTEVKASLFYDEKSFKEFIEATPFTKANFIKEGGDSIWVIKK
ncbi:MAG: class I SAM-dependent methyltransferase [Candidatus Lokiarchaeota archaeon]|nr:class I SAM-dependent methyltransferase [Candidatus Lokiarchaeota archaeon]